jgi:hypothetical protein
MLGPLAEQQNIHPTTATTTAYLDPQLGLVIERSYDDANGVFVVLERVGSVVHVLEVRARAPFL